MYVKSREALFEIESIINANSQQESLTTHARIHPKIFSFC
jgi:hypothetical protein